MATLRKAFECTRCGHMELVYGTTMRCPKCGSQTGVVKLVDEGDAQRLLDQRTGDQAPAD